MKWSLGPCVGWVEGRICFALFPVCCFPKKRYHEFCWLFRFDSFVVMSEQSEQHHYIDCSSWRFWLEEGYN